MPSSSLASNTFDEAAGKFGRDASDHLQRALHGEGLAMPALYHNAKTLRNFARWRAEFPWSTTVTNPDLKLSAGDKLFGQDWTAEVASANVALKPRLIVDSMGRKSPLKSLSPGHRDRQIVCDSKIPDMSRRAAISAGLFGA